jgi:hypothetical protein
MPYGTIVADQIQNTSGQTLGAGNSSIMKNRIINGAMVIDQRNAGASVTPTGGVIAYTLDRWAIYVGESSKLTIQQNAGSVTPPAGFTNYIGVTSSSAYSVASGDIFELYQSIEGYNLADMSFGTANAKTFTISFWVRSSLTGSFGASFQNGALNRSYPFTYTISAANTWEQKSVTIAGDTSGTWTTNNSSGGLLVFSLGAGSTFSGTANTWQVGNIAQPTGSVSLVGTNGATFYITGVQLEVGSSATGFEYRQYQQELALCQRYFYAPSNTPSFSLAWVPNAALFMGGGISHPVTMRASPTISGVTSFTIQGITASATGFSMTGSPDYLSVASNNSNGQADGALRSVNANQIPLVSAEL